VYPYVVVLVIEGAQIRYRVRTLPGKRAVLPGADSEGFVAW
jgi:hypothetical protein